MLFILSSWFFSWRSFMGKSCMSPGRRETYVTHPVGRHRARLKALSLQRRWNVNSAEMFSHPDLISTVEPQLLWNEVQTQGSPQGAGARWGAHRGLGPAALALCFFVLNWRVVALRKLVCSLLWLWVLTVLLSMVFQMNFCCCEWCFKWSCCCVKWRSVVGLNEFLFWLMFEMYFLCCWCFE